VNQRIRRFIDGIPRRSQGRLRLEIAIASAGIAAIAVGLVTFTTHVIGPVLFTHYDHFPALAQIPKRTVNVRGYAGDPINVAIVASSDSELAAAFRRAGWTEADPITRASSIGIAKSVLLGRPDSAAPVSPLYLFGRQQDHAFEREVGRSASRRHHVRLWRVAGLTYEGRSVWIGDASFDVRAGISHHGLHPTHHIDPDVDTERDDVESDLAHASEVAEAFHVTGFGLRIDARNAEGDRFDTDGELLVIVTTPAGTAHTAPRIAPDPWLVRMKERVYAWAHR